MDYTPLVENPFYDSILNPVPMFLLAMVGVLFMLGASGVADYIKAKTTGTKVCSIIGLVLLVGGAATMAWSINHENDSRSQNLDIIKQNVSLKYNVSADSVDLTTADADYAGLYSLVIGANASAIHVNVKFYDNGEPFIVVPDDDEITIEFLESIKR